MKEEMPLHLKTNLVEIVFIEVAVGELKKYDMSNLYNRPPSILTFHLLKGLPGLPYNNKSRVYFSKVSTSIHISTFKKP